MAHEAQRADLEKQPAQVARMFDDVAARYDRTNTLLSLGRDRSWRRHMVSALQLEPGMLVADIAAGTAVSTAQLARTGAWAVAVDFSLGMLRAAKPSRRVPKVAADALSLPFGDGTVDAVTIAFGLRNVVDPLAALTEFARITKPGGQLLVCEFSQPPRWVRPFYRIHLNHVLPALARRFAANPDAYTYLQESIAEWPGAADLARLIARAGWEDVAWRSMTFGVVALHHAVKPFEPESTDPGGPDDRPDTGRSGTVGEPRDGRPE